MTKFALAASLATSLSSFAQAAAPPDAGTAVPDIADVSLEALLETKVSVASAAGTTVTSAESPGVVTVITREEIHDMGARDLIDVLRFVPGFDFNSDVQNTVGLSVRGIWALEGKALLLIDGMPYNDLEYGNALLGNREPVDLIERIEIIRGPGSAVYGGFAALAVINIVTRADKPVNRVLASTTYGQMPRAVGHANASLLGSYSFGDMNVQAHAFTGYAIRSDRGYPAGVTLFDMAKDSEMRALNVGISVDWKGLLFNLMYDDYLIEAPVADAPDGPLIENHRTAFAQLKWNKKLSDLVTVNAYARYLFQVPWQANTSRDLEVGYYSDKRIHRGQIGASGTFAPVSWLSLLIGLEGSIDTAIAQPHDNEVVDEYNAYIDLDGEAVPQLTFFNLAAFAEASVITPVVNITAGVRFDYHNAYGPTVVPRVALTKEIGKFHFKALAARAFRAPVFENISYGTLMTDQGLVTVRPEYINVFELEAGFQVASWLTIAANVFDNRVSPTMVYQEIDNYAVYVNGGTTGTHGIEVDLRSRGSWGYVTLGYTFYEATVRGVEQYLVEGHPELFLGVPQHRFTMHASLRLGEHLAFNPALIVYSDRYGLEAPLDGSDAVVTRFGPTAVADLFLVWRNAGAKGFDVSMGVHDLFNSGYRWISAYNSLTNALPAPGTEIMLRLSFLNDFVP